MTDVIIAVRRLKGLTGASRIVFAQLQQLRQQGYCVSVFAEKADQARLRELGVHFKRCPRLPLLNRYWTGRWFNYCFQRYRKHYKNSPLVIGHGDIEQQDILFLHNIVQREQAALGILCAPAVKHVIQLHHRLLTQQAFTYCIANSQLMKDELIKTFSIPAEKIYVAHPGYNPDQFDVSHKPIYRKALREKLNLKDHDVVVGLITSGSFFKRGLDICLQTMAQLPESTQHNTKLLLVGNTQEIQALKQKYAPQLPENNLLIVPKTSAIEHVYSAMDIFFYPARLEEFGLVLQEAAVFGLPILTSINTGASELFTGIGRDFVITSNQPSDYLASLIQLIEDRNLREKLGQCLQTCTQHNTERYYLEKIEQILEDNTSNLQPS